MNLPELLSPAGGAEQAIAAINAGADALYLGGKNFSARSAAQNFDDNAIVELIQYAAVRNVRIFVAVNTLYKNAELPQVVQFVADMYRAGAAAFILQDAGLAYILKEQFPQIEIHASTQMTVHSTAGVNFMESMGFSRVVLARELSLGEVAEINAATNIECEVFVHGALCVSYSGQCLMSSLIGGRSGNRGKCAQICRTKFALHGAPAYLLSPKDMMTLEMLDKIVATGVSSLKIEGRMKSPEYVYLVTKAYRERLDNLNAPVQKETVRDLLQIFNRGGSFCTGNYNASPPDISLMSTKTPKSTGVLVGSVASYSNGKCTIKFDQEVNPGDGIEIWTTSGDHVGTGISKRAVGGQTLEVGVAGAIEKGCAVYKSYDKVLADATKKAITTNEKKITVTGTVRAIAGEPLRLIVGAAIGRPNIPNIAVEKTGDIVETAQTAPMSTHEIIAQLSKTGGTPFTVEFALQSCEISENIFVSKAALNQLRRDALAELETAMKASVSRNGDYHVRLASENDSTRDNAGNSERDGKKDRARNSASDEHPSPVIAGQARNDRAYASLGDEVKSSLTSGLLRFARNDGRVDNARPGGIAAPQTLSVQLHNPAHLPAALSAGVARIYVNINDFPPTTPIQNPHNTEIFLTLPPISRNATEANIDFAKLETAAFDGYLVSTYGQLQLLQSMLYQPSKTFTDDEQKRAASGAFFATEEVNVLRVGMTTKKIMLNHSFNIFNNHALQFFATKNVNVTLSQELNLHEISAMTHGFELIAYGRQTLMATHNCPVGLYGKCGTANAILTDRTGANFPIQTDCHNCTAYILNGKTLDTSSKFQSLKNTAAASFRLIFTTEDENTLRDTITRYQEALRGLTNIPAKQNADITYGHYFRGVE